MSLTQRLIPHPSFTTDWFDSLEATWSRETGGIFLRYILSGEIGRLKIPTPSTPMRRDGLWRHTCFELFVATKETPSYLEFNFSPSGDWQTYIFRSYREGGLLEPAPVPAIVMEVGEHTLTVESRLSTDALPASECLRLGLSAILEANDGSMTYWALSHAPGKPDFHHPDTFALEIDLRNPQP